MTKQLANQVSAIAVAVGVLFFLGSAAHWLTTKNSTTNLEQHSSLTDRDAAIDRAKNGNGEYSFSTNFIPGLGQSVSPDQARDDFKTANPNAVTN